MLLKAQAQHLRTQRWLLGWLACGGCLLGSGCAARLDSAECDALLNRYTEQLLREGNPAISAAQIKKGQDRARGLARERAEFEFDACPRQVSRAQYTCALAAPTVDEIERCLKR